MADAYVPGLRVTPSAVLRRARRLPLPGDVRVVLGQQVAAGEVVARAPLPGPAEVLPAATILGVDPADLPRRVAKQAGQPVAAGEVLATVRGPFGLGRRELRSPCDGTIELISAVTGQLTLRRPPGTIDVRAHLAGRVVELLPGEGAVIEAHGALVQGVFGAGGECRGELVYGGDPRAGSVWVVPGPLSRADLDRAVRAGAAGVVAASVHDADLDGSSGDDRAPTVVVTEGFGQLPMSERASRLLRSLAGRGAALSGSTQIRAGVLRPEVFVPREAGGARPERAPKSSGLIPGATVRLIRTPEFGAVGRVVSLPGQPREIATGARVRVAEVRLRDGQVLTVPRANLELVEE